MYIYIYIYSYIFHSSLRQCSQLAAIALASGFDRDHRAILQALPENGNRRRVPEEKATGDHQRQGRKNGKIIGKP